MDGCVCETTGRRELIAESDVMEQFGLHAYDLLLVVSHDLRSLYVSTPAAERVDTACHSIQIS